MSRILIHTLREHGHVLPTLRLARALTAAGHHVEHLLTPAWRAFAAAQRIALRTYLEDIFPEAAEAAWARMDRAAREADAERRNRERVAFLVGGGLDAVYRAAAPDLILGDAYDVSIPIVARRLGIPVALLSPSLFQGRDPGVPPLTSGLAFGADDTSRAAAEAAWQRLADQRRGEAARDWYPRYVEAMVAAYRFPRAELSWDGAIAPDFRGLPQLVLAPRALEFPRTLPRRCHYDIPCMTERDEVVPPALAAWLARRPLVYCAPGSQGLWRPQHRELIAQVLALAARRPDLAFVVASGEPDGAPDVAATGNVLVVGWAPQQAVLRAADVMITVGGLGTIKECLWSAVPMVLLPHLNPYDAPGNAQRVAFHGLGVVVTPEGLARGELARAIDRAFAQEFAAPLRRMQAEFRRVEAGDRGRALVERLLRGERTEEEQ